MQFNLQIPDLNILERETIDQLRSPKWHAERRKRLTASNFGIICKAKVQKTLETKLKDVLYKKDTYYKIKAIKYGQENEERALQKYKEIHSSYVIRSTGLWVHKEFQYFGCSPDALVNENGILEIKCPYSVKDIHPGTAIKAGKLDFLSEDGMLKEWHNYNFQIQDQLAITQKKWCDLCVYSSKGIYIVRIFQKKSFIDNMFQKLQDIYFFYYLPEIVDPTDLCKRRWWPNYNLSTDKHLIFFPHNELIKDFQYYKEIKGKNYTIAKYEFIDCYIKSITFEDFDSLTANKWLNNLVIDVLLAIYNYDHQNKNQIIPCVTSTSLLNDGCNSSFQIKKDALVMPININQNHWSILFINFKKKTVTYINPFSTSKQEALVYKEKFLNMLGSYNILNNTSYDTHDWKVDMVEHLMQNDSCNCGVFIIYFFKQYSDNNSLADSEDMNNYRYHLKEMIIERSSNMQGLCLLLKR